MLKQRVITAVLLAAVVLWALFGWSDFWYGMLLLVATFACAWEWSALGNMRQLLSRGIFSAVVTVGAGFLVWLGSWDMMRPLVLVAVLLWVTILIDLYVRPVVKTDDSTVRWPLLLLAVYILILSVVSLYWLRVEQSATFIVYVVTLVAAADIGAYFSGRKFGRRKLAVEISQGKTLEGAIGGLVAALLLALLSVNYFSNEQTTALSLFVFSVIAAVFSIAGDLFISRAKRTRGVKDSGNLLPGHGGVLDRFDGLLAAIPWMAFAILWT